MSLCGGAGADIRGINRTAKRGDIGGNSEARGGGTGHSTEALPEGGVFVQQPDTCHEDPGVLCA